MPSSPRQLAKRIVPDRLVRGARTVQHVRRLGLWRAWLASQSNRAGKRRLGNAYGGWTIPSERLAASSICYCVGCGEDISFDLALIDTYGCTVHGVDPTPDSIDFVRRTAGHVPAYRLHKVALWHDEGTMRFYAPSDPTHVSHSLTNLQGTDDFIEVTTCRLRTLMERLDHAHLDLLKLDVEGAECDILDTLLADAIDCRTLCVEFDELLYPTPERIARIRATVAAILAAGYRLFWVESTNFTFVRK